MVKYWKAWNIAVSILGKQTTNYIEWKELKTEEGKFQKGTYYNFVPSEYVKKVY
jgi:hypothetical protein